MLRQFGIALPEGMRLQLKNIAAVAVHAQLPAFAKPGRRSTSRSPRWPTPRACAAAHC